jgi:hypothetical protein
MKNVVFETVAHSSVQKKEKKELFFGKAGKERNK